MNSYTYVTTWMHGYMHTSVCWPVTDLYMLIPMVVCKDLIPGHSKKLLQMLYDP